MNQNILPMEKFDICLTVFNQEKLIPRIIKGLFDNTTTPFNLIIVFDGCTDKSQEVVEKFIKENKPKLLCDLRITTAPNVYEAKANNVTFRLATEDYLVTLQDDMLIEEKGWERRLTFPLRIYNDIFAVTARGTMNIIASESSPEPKYVDLVGREYMNLRRNQFAIRSAINRGPIALKRDILKKLNYFDEYFAPGGQLDDADLCFRALRDFGMKCGAYWIDYRSDISWGKSRQPSNSTRPNLAQILRRNLAYIKKNIPDAVSGKLRIVENRIISDSEIDYREKRDSKIQLLKKSLFRNSWFIWVKINRKLNGIRVRINKIKSILHA